MPRRKLSKSARALQGGSGSDTKDGDGAMQGSNAPADGASEERQRGQEEDTGARLPDLIGLTLDMPRLSLSRQAPKQANLEGLRSQGIAIPGAQGFSPVPIARSTTPLASPSLGIAIPLNPPQTRPGVIPGQPSKTAQGLARAQGVAIAGGQAPSSPVAPTPTAPKQPHVSPELQAVRAAGLASAVQAADALLASRSPAPAPSSSPASASPSAPAPRRTAADVELTRRKSHAVREAQRIEAHIARLRPAHDRLRSKAALVAAAVPPDASSHEVLGRQLRAMWEVSRCSPLLLCLF